MRFVGSVSVVDPSFCGCVFVCVSRGELWIKGCVGDEVGGRDWGWENESGRGSGEMSELI